MPPAPSLEWTCQSSQRVRPRPALKGSRPAYFTETGDFVDTPVYDRYLLGRGSTLRGPAIVEERESTAVIGPRGSAEIDRYGNLVVTLVA